MLYLHVHAVFFFYKNQPKFGSMYIKRTKGTVLKLNSQTVFLHKQDKYKLNAPFNSIQLHSTLYATKCILSK